MKRRRGTQAGRGGDAREIRTGRRGRVPRYSCSREMTDFIPFSAGSFCRLIHASSLLQNATSLLTFEFTTPRSGIATPQGVLACLTADGQDLEAPTTSLM